MIDTPAERAKREVEMLLLHKTGERHLAFGGWSKPATIPTVSALLASAGKKADRSKGKRQRYPDYGRENREPRSGDAPGAGRRAPRSARPGR